MARKEVGSDVSEELTRESLIAISYSLPDNNYSSIDISKSAGGINNNVNEAVNTTDEKEKYMSELISLSYPKSPDSKKLPLSPAKNKDEFLALLETTIAAD